MPRLLKLLVLVAVGAATALLVVRLRASRQSASALGGDAPLVGSFDTWPEVPLKQSA
jgi:hypothetical protein